MCSRRSKRLMQSIRHPGLTDIEVTIDRFRMYVKLKNRMEDCLSWSIKTELEVELFRHLYRDDDLGGVNVKVMWVISLFKAYLQNGPDMGQPGLLGVGESDIRHLRFSDFFRRNSPKFSEKKVGEFRRIPETTTLQTLFLGYFYW